MSRKLSPAASRAHAKNQQAKRTFFTPVNVVFSVLGLAGIVAASVYAFDSSSATATTTAAPPSSGTPDSSTTTAATPPAPIVMPISTASTDTSAPPASTNELIQSRMMISPPPDPAAGMAGQPVSNLEGITLASGLALFQTERPTLGLDPFAPGTRVPVNATDLFTGKPTGYASPTKMHKGYTVAFCCANSGGYNGNGWDNLTEAEKDTYVRHFLK